MKLSNKILIGFFVFIFIYLSAAFAELRLKGTPWFLDDENSIAETVDLPGVKNIVVKGLKKSIHIKPSDKPRLEIRSFSGGVLKDVKYHVSGDTLTMSGIESDENLASVITVFVSTGIEAITVNDAVAVLDGFGQDHLRISGSKGRTWISNSSFQKLSFDASDRSLLEISTATIDTLSAKIKESDLVVLSPADVLVGTAEEHSSVRVHVVKQIQFMRDDTSTLNIYQ